MGQDMPRMQDFAPFTPEPWPYGKRGGQVHFSVLIGQANNFLDSLNFELGCPNDY